MSKPLIHSVFADAQPSQTAVANARRINENGKISPSLVGKYDLKKNTAPKFYLIDDCEQGRSNLSRMMISSGYSIEPFACVEEFSGAWLGRRFILMRDRPGAFRAIVKLADSVQIWPRVILYADHPLAQDVCTALKIGAAGYIKTPNSSKQVIEYIEDEEGYFSIITKIKNSAYRASKSLSILSDREREILVLVSDGFRNNEVADNLGLSTRTVEVHRANLIKKLGLKSSANAFRLVVESSFMST